MSVAEVACTYICWQWNTGNCMLLAPPEEASSLIIFVFGCFVQITTIAFHIIFCLRALYFAYNVRGLCVISVCIFRHSDNVTVC